MSNDKLDVVGTKFGKLTIISESVQKESKYTKYICRCDCGNEVLKFYKNLKNGGDNQSCGCLLFTNRIDISGK